MNAPVSLVVASLAVALPLAMALPACWGDDVREPGLDPDGPLVAPPAGGAGGAGPTGERAAPTGTAAPGQPAQHEQTPAGAGTVIAATATATPGAAESSPATATADVRDRKPGPDGILRLPSLRVDTRAKVVEVDGRVCLQRGLIEVFACTHYGKVHEAVLILDCRPEHLNLGLILLDMEPKRGQVSALGQGGALEGERVVVTVSWTDESGAAVTHRAEELLLDQRDGGTMAMVGFTYTGSRFIRIAGREVYAANASGQMVTTYHDPDAILDNPLPKGGDDTIYYANSSILPPQGTPVLVRLRKATPGDVK